MTKVDSHKYKLLSLDALYAQLCSTVKEMSDAIYQHNHKKFNQTRKTLALIRSTIKEKKKTEKVKSFFW